MVVRAIGFQQGDTSKNTGAPEVAGELRKERIQPGSCIGAGFAADLVPGGRKGRRGGGVVGLRGGWVGEGRPKTGVVAGCGDRCAGIALATLGMRLGVKA